MLAEMPKNPGNLKFSSRSHDATTTKTLEGKSRSSRNAHKHGMSKLHQELRKLLRQQGNRSKH